MGGGLELRRGAGGGGTSEEARCNFSGQNEEYKTVKNLRVKL